MDLLHGPLDCTRSDVLGASASYPVITFTVNVANNATSGTNVATVAGGGEIITANDTANDATTITPFQNITISGTKFNDLNGNGAKNGGESGCSNWTIQLINPSNSNVISTTTTDANGDYNFTNLVTGTYRVREVLKRDGCRRRRIQPHLAQSGVNVTGIDFGNFEQITMSGKCFNDLNGDGVENGGEAGLPDWTIHLTEQSTNIMHDDDRWERQLQLPESRAGDIQGSRSVANGLGANHGEPFRHRCVERHKCER